MSLFFDRRGYKYSNASLTISCPPRSRRTSASARLSAENDLKSYPISKRVAPTDGRIYKKAPQLGSATARTFTTIARVLAEAEGTVEGAVLTLDQVAGLAGSLASVDAANRADLPGIGSERAGIIVAGVTLAEMAMRALGLSMVHVHEGGVGRGILLEMAAD